MEQGRILDEGALTVDFITGPFHGSGFILVG
jgi:hypothetical protein